MYVTHEQGAGARGFTLVELLVVVAIIGILAGIVVPNVTRHIRKSRIARAAAEIRNIDTSLAGMLSDVGRSRFSDFIVWGDGTQQAKNDAFDDLENVNTALRFYSNFFYKLLLNGRDAEEDGPISSVPAARLEVDLRPKLGSSYMNIGKDPWNKRYNFWFGPIPRRTGFMPFRSFRAVNEDFDFAYYIYDGPAKQAADAEIPGNPPADYVESGEDAGKGKGYPAPRTFPVYIWSSGPNQVVDAFVDAPDYEFSDDVFRGGGDDINNWDNEAGWNDAPE